MLRMQLVPEASGLALNEWPSKADADIEGKGEGQSTAECPLADRLTFSNGRCPWLSGMLWNRRLAGSPGQVVDKKGFANRLARGSKGTSVTASQRAKLRPGFSCKICGSVGISALTDPCGP